MIYLVKSNNWYKFGYAKNLFKRVKQYSTYNPDIQFIAYREGDERLESELHLKFKDYKHEYRKEWFLVPEEKIIQLIKEYGFVDASKENKDFFYTTYKEKKKKACANYSEETRERLSMDGKKGVGISIANRTPKSYKREYGKTNKRSMEINQYTLNGEYITTHTTASNAARAVGANYVGSHILDCCRGNRRTAAGYKWKFNNIV